MDKLNRKVTQFINKHDLFEKGTTILVGVSGGPDSMALLYYLNSIKDDWGLRIIALTVDHQLRGTESLEDLQFVQQKCREWNIEFKGTSVDVPDYKRQYKVGTQVAARELRYNYFYEQMELFHANCLVLGHHGDDQAETMLMRLVRSADSQSLAGIPVKRPFAKGLIVRPFLCVTKDEIWQYCRRHDIESRIDPSNQETTYTRNFFRKHVLPLIKEKNSNIHTTIQHLSETLHADQSYLKQQAEKMTHDIVLFDKKNKFLSFSIPTFKTYAFALQRRAYHLILNYLYIDLPKDLSYVHEEQFFSLLHHQTGNTRLDFPEGLKIEKSYDQIRISFNQDGRPDSYHKLLEVPGRAVLPDGSVIIAEYVENSLEQSEFTFVCYKEQVELPLHIRTREQGDRMRWKGLKGSKKVKDIFIDAKIPRFQRENWPIVTDNQGTVLWLVGLKKGQPAKRVLGASLIQLYYDKGNM